MKKYYVYDIAMRNASGGIKAFEIASTSLAEAIAYLERTESLSFAYEIKL
jgi:hypothetical protein